MPTYLNQICRKNPPFLYNLRHGLFYTTNLQKATQVDQDFPPVETWMFSRSLEPLQPSRWVTLAPSPTLVWPATLQDLRHQNPCYSGAEPGRFNMKKQPSHWKKRSSLRENHPMKSTKMLQFLKSTTNLPMYNLYYICTN